MNTQDLNGYSAAFARCVAAVSSAPSCHEQADALILDAVPAMAWALEQMTEQAPPPAPPLLNPFAWMTPLLALMTQPPAPPERPLVVFKLGARTYDVLCESNEAAAELVEALRIAFGATRVV